MQLVDNAGTTPGVDAAVAPENNVCVCVLAFGAQLTLNVSLQILHNLISQLSVLVNDTALTEHPELYPYKGACTAVTQVSFACTCNRCVPLFQHTYITCYDLIRSANKPYCFPRGLLPMKPASGISFNCSSTVSITSNFRLLRFNQGG